MTLRNCENAECLAIAYELEHLKRRKMAKHSRISLKYRDAWNYQKKKVKALELYLLQHNLDPKDAFTNHRRISNEEILPNDTHENTKTKQGDSYSV